jgi:chondroitin 4-sulfotransferase 11
MAAINLPDHKLTFVHIPKNGGSSVVQWLRENFNTEIIKNHPSMSMIKIEWDVHRSFAIVRNPWDRVVSAYFYLKQYGFYWENNNITSESDFPSFDSFVNSLNYNLNSWNSIDTNQCEWLDGSDTLILRAETLDNDFKQIQDMLNFYAPLPYINTSEHLDYKSYFNSSQIEHVRKVFAKDIDMFGYTY